MYTETRNNFSMRTVVLQFLFVALFIFILIWLFPMKSDMKKAINSIDTSNEDLSIIYDRIFNENILLMKESAKEYFTTSRLPQKVGGTVKITLGDMLDKKIILPFVDKNGKQCDLDDSYVQITKKADEFVMKVNLKCGKEENYLITYLGCYDYCSQTICEKRTIKKPVKVVPKKPAKPSKPAKPVKPVKPVKPEEPKPEEPKYRTLYEYKKVTDGTTNYTDWSEWSTNYVAPSNTVEVKYKKAQVKKLVAYKKTTQDDLTKPIFTTQNVLVGSTEVKVCTSYNVTSTITGYKETYLGTVKLTSAPTSTSTVRYERVGTYNWYCDGDCTSGTVYLYKVYQRTPITSSSYSCASYKTEKTVYTAQKTILTGYEKKVTTEPVYEYSTKTYYSYRTKITTPGQIILKWSTYNDTNLLNDGYNYTGNTKTELINE